MVIWGRLIIAGRGNLAEGTPFDIIYKSPIGRVETAHAAFCGAGLRRDFVILSERSSGSFGAGLCAGCFGICRT
jgi:hypothetical protein